MFNVLTCLLYFLSYTLFNLSECPQLHCFVDSNNSQIHFYLMSILCNQSFRQNVEWIVLTFQMILSFHILHLLFDKDSSCVLNIRRYSLKFSIKLIIIQITAQCLLWSTVFYPLNPMLLSVSLCLQTCVPPFCLECWDVG